MINELSEKGIQLDANTIESFKEIEAEYLRAAYKEGATNYAANLDVEIIKEIEWDAYLYSKQ
jgi:hypothetical protein